MRAQAIAGCLVGLAVCVAKAQGPVQPASVPLQAELIKHAHVRNLAKGATIFARVTVEWKGPGCVLRRGAILEGEVESAEPRKGKSPSTLALLFKRAQCNGADLSPLRLVLVSVAEAPSAVEAVPGVQLTTDRYYGVAVPTRGGVTDMNIPRLQLATEDHHFPLKNDMQAGDVLGIRGLKLAVATGPDHSSVLSSRADVNLSPFTQMLLLPETEVLASARALAAAQSTAAGVAAAVSAKDEEAPEPMPPPEPPAPVNTLDDCAPPGCAVDLPVTVEELAGHTAASIAVRPLGYKPRVRKVLEDFDEDQALAWLGGDKLLFTFNAHPLIQRAPGREQTMRVVRAMLLDVHTKQVTRSLEWQIPDKGRFLWQLGTGRILAHVGNELLIYRRDLEVERRLALSGPLAFVRISPNGELMAVATLRERHSAALHAKLRQELGADPEEDVDVRVLDTNFNVISSAVTTSGIMPPTLLNEGQVVLLSQPNLGYRLALKKWNNTSETLARFESLCTPRLSSVAPDLLFLASCDMRSGGAEFRIVRNDGKLMLRGNTGTKEMGLDAAGNARAFAVKIVVASRDMAPGVSFTAGDLEWEEVRVYRTEDGKRMRSVRVDAPPTSRESYALSPDGLELAVLSGTEIEIFAVPQG